VLRDPHDARAGAPGIIGGMADDDEARVLALPQAPEAVELRHLRAFVAVAEELNFGRAAERLYVSQPALSRQIRALERGLGCELLRRSTHRVELTIAGDALLDRARRVLADVDEAVSATQAVGGELSNRVAKLFAPLAEIAAADTDLDAMRAAYEELCARFEPPPEVATRSVIAGGVPALLLEPARGAPATILHLHGGGFVMGSAFGARALVGAFAAAAGSAALVPEYRLAPEHPFPSALEDAERAYLWLLDRGTPPEQIVVAGDSAGCHIALSLLQTLRAQELPLPGGAALLCPWLDLTAETVMGEHARTYAESYAGGVPLDDPLLAPLEADLSGLPPLLIQVATGDDQAPDCRRLTERARAHGVDARLALYPGDTHVFHIFWSFLPEAADALREAGEFARARREAPPLQQTA
jgi:acetyl esterase/lipase